MVIPPPARKTDNLGSWHALFDLTILSAYFYVSMEWLFFVTKPSSLSLLSLLELAEVLFVTAGAVALVLLAFLLLLSLPALLIRDSDWRPRLLTITYAVPALILSITALIMLDNFTYTVFKFGVVSTKDFSRAIYALGFMIFYWRMVRFTERTVRLRRKFTSYLSLSLLFISMVGILTNKLPGDLGLTGLDAEPGHPAGDYPNIIILGGDGLSASYLTAYGFELKTTPFLSELIQTSLVAENAFPNASSTTGSTTSVLTGKEPIAARVFRYPDILSGKDSFEHLPGILRKHGFQTVEIGTPHYVDARRLNLLEGFDIVNNRAMNSPAVDMLRTALGNSPSAHFLETMTDRVSERLLQIFFIKQMQNPLAQVYDAAARISDDQRVDQIISLLDHADRPVFIFAHLMDTHGPDFSVQKEVFSRGSSVSQDWDQSRYLDAILSFDGHVKRIYDHLAETGKLDHTILVIYTDHGFKYAINQRIPIIIHFPHNAYAGTRQNNVQTIDIPVTLLDYLSIPPPEWMNGTSLLDGEPPADREILGTTTGSPNEIAPPFYQINILQVIVCHRWYALNVREKTLASGTIRGHTAKCDEDLLPAEELAHQRILDYLKKFGYNVSSLE